MHEMVDCDAVMRQLWDYLDGELTPERERAIRAHAAVCARCFPQMDFEQSFLRALAAARPEAGVSMSLESRVMVALRAEGFAP